MKVIIAGSRELTDMKLVEQAIAESKFVISEVVCGGARGIDDLGRQWAEERGIPVVFFNADWDTFGKSAGYRRNKEMAQYADALVAIWDGKSRGTANMIQLAKHHKLKGYVLTAVAPPARIPPRNGSRPRNTPKPVNMFDE